MNYITYDIYTKIERGVRNHHINFLSIASQIYIVDVGFGGPGPTHPVPLTHGLVSAWGATRAEIRVMYHPPVHAFVNGTWHYQHRPSGAGEWRTVYSFSMTEFRAADYEVMSFAVSRTRNLFFTFQIVCMKMVYEEDEEGVGDVTGILFLVDGTLKRRRFEETEVVVECKSEEERVRVLEEYFGIVLSERERKGIKGSVTEIKQSV